MNTRKSFSIKEAYKFSANSTIDHISTLLKLSLIWIAIWLGVVLLTSLCLAAACFPYLSILPPLTLTNIPTIATTCFTGVSAAAISLLIPITLALSSFLLHVFEFQLLRLAKAYYTGSSVTISELFTLRGTKFLTFWAARVLFVIKYFVGLLLFIIPGIYILCTYFFSGYSILEGVTDSISEDARLSAQLLDKVKWRLVAALLLLSLFFPRATGLYILIVYPVGIFIAYSIYKQLKKSTLTDTQEAVQLDKDQ